TVNVTVGCSLEHAGGGRDVHDRAVTTFQHARQKCPDRPVHRLDVEVERKIPVSIRAFEHGAVMYEACGVEQDVDLADAFCHFADGRRVAHVKLCDLGHAILGERRET